MVDRRARCLGLCVVAIRGLLNARLGVTGAFSEVIDRVEPPQPARSTGAAGSSSAWWSAGSVFALVRGGPGFDGYGWLTRDVRERRRLDRGDPASVAGVLIGFGAKTAGGCTSGNGLTGTSMLSRAALVATATFFGTAIVVSFVIEALTMRLAGLLVGRRVRRRRCRGPA